MAVQKSCRDEPRKVAVEERGHPGRSRPYAVMLDGGLESGYSCSPKEIGNDANGGVGGELLPIATVQNATQVMESWCIRSKQGEPSSAGKQTALSDKYCRTVEEPQA